MNRILCRRPVVQGLVFIVVAGTLAHLAYSRYGFNPTDEGYLLSASRRILDGQVPHRDYITLRPAGTHLLHAHILLWGGDRLIWWSRWVAWVQVAAIAWIWVWIVGRSSTALTGAGARFAGGVAAFVACAHVFPIMPWNSIDGLLFLSLGSALSLREGGAVAGAVLIGASALFRQNFVLGIPPLLLVLGTFRRPACWVAAGVPFGLYGVFLWVAGALPDATIQLFSHSGSADRVWTVVRESLAVLRGALAAVVALSVATFVGRWPVRGAIYLSLGAALWLSLRLLGLPFTQAGLLGGWFVCGLAIGVLPFTAGRSLEAARAAALSLVAAWAVSISEGWNLPSLACGGPVLVFFAAWLEAEARNRSPAPFAPVIVWTLLAAAAVVVMDFNRQTAVYMDRPVRELTFDLTGVLPGARGILTGRFTRDFLAELEELRADLTRRGRRYGLIPQTPQFWVTSPQPNPLSSDWPINAELNHPALRSRVVGEIDRLRGSVSFIV
ncbi:MAG: hypothetical protein HY815_25220 [Candidatus Riflebacteria bacterium]|nr:hypothetical protein [Candidatus Riflebacteria bacterium]